MFKKIFLVLFALAVTGTNAQKMGFGCFGLVGGFGGYSFQAYNADGLNNYIDAFNKSRKDTLTQSMSKFKASSGYRFGMNFFRANIKNLVLTTKGFYQSMSESHDAKLASASKDYSALYELNVNSWGVGVDIGAKICKPFVWKVIDASVLFNSSEFKITNNYPEAITTIDKYSDDSNLSYSIGTGFIYSIIANYISLEGTFGYSLISVKNLKNDDGKKLNVDEKSNVEMDGFIKSGGINALLQLNISFPI